ncbi:hypothetical protein [Pedobacter hiemivivus]|uniref:Uncharacterized protein n=1 Tax=Pedobacter hiemivivus TaxID=2530454 RepID=A0A4R0M9K3_9SPHI|nr:hypothetical protein [Pedobacter hiemivivus]TCC82821.1 hypothetical protein EZ444_26355 [Pedobacter hiemivivus]
MKKYRLYILLFLFIFTACKKDGEVLNKTVTVRKTLPVLKGYTMVPLLKYFDGEETRGELYGSFAYNAGLAFENENDQTHMQLRNSITGEVVYEHTFKATDKPAEVPVLLYDGKKLKESHEYQDLSGADYLVNFNFNFPGATEPIYLTLKVWESYLDPTTYDLVEFPAVSATFSGGIKPGEWSEYVRLKPVAELVTITSQSPQEAIDMGLSFITHSVSITDAQGKPYPGFPDGNNMLNLQFPEQWTTTGKVQSIHGIIKKNDIGKNYLIATNLAEKFPKK